MEVFLTKPQLLDRARSIDSNINYDAKVAPIVKEVAQYELKLQLGDAFFNLLLDYLEAKQAGGTANQHLDLLMQGGSYTYEGKKYRLDGLHTTVAYYVYAKLVPSQAGNLGATGLRTPNDQYNSLADFKDRQTTQTEVKRMADSYMTDCLSYLKRKASDTGFVGCDTRQRKTNFIVIKS